jgi:N-succinyldiaminopimelate aminotransferase
VISDKLRPFGTTIFAEMTELATKHEAINLSQGFPDFEGPDGIIEAAVAALHSGDNQYARSQGHAKLVEAIAAKQTRDYSLDLDPYSEVNVFSGATEGIAASFLGLLNPGDEVILFEPFYDSYPACTALAGATARFCTLRFPEYALDVEALEAAVNEKTRLIVLNSPHNPTGKVFTRQELEAIARVACEHDLIVLTDEVYEYLTYDDAEHIPMATLPGMFERTLSLSSSGKTFSFTGWKIGWATGPRELVAAAQSAHQFLTFAVATPLQVAMAHALNTFHGEYIETIRAEYTERRDFLVSALRDTGFDVAVPQGTYFVLADFTALFDGDDRAFARHLIETCGVATIPPSVFFMAQPEVGRRLIRFAFCKRRETLEKAADRLRRLVS